MRQGSRMWWAVLGGQYSLLKELEHTGKLRMSLVISSTH